LSLVVGLSMSSATVDQERLLSEFTTEVRQQVHASADALSKLDSVHQDMRMLADLVARSRRAQNRDPATERRVWESAFRALAVVVVHYRIIALVGADGSLAVQAVDPTEDPSTALTLLPRIEGLGAEATMKGAERLGSPELLGTRSFLLYATPVAGGGAIVVASDAALLLRTVAWPQVPFGRLFVTDPAGVTWSGCEAAGGCQVAAPHVVPTPAALSTRSPVHIDAQQASRLGLFPADAIWLSENVARPAGAWSVIWVASTQRMRAREKSALRRTVTTAVAAAIVVALVGVVLLRQQHRTDQLGSQLRYATAMARAHELENQLVRADRLVTVGVMATEIAHEIGTPLSVVRGRAEQVLPVVTDARGVEDLRVVIKQVDHISATVRQLLDFSRRSPLEPLSVSLETIVERARELLQLKLEARGLQMDVRLMDDLPLLTADPDQLQQVLVNLLLNACDASRPGETISVAARCAPKELVLIEVSDHGSGIDAEHLDSVFDPFFTTKPRGQGTGLGLPIAAGIVRNHGGQINIKSVRDEGTTVSVLWPASGAGDAHG
jgi:signal transduction histidine kinase